MIEGAISMVGTVLAAALEFLGLEALANRVAGREEPRDPRNFPPPR